MEAVRFGIPVAVRRVPGAVAASGAGRLGPKFGTHPLGIGGRPRSDDAADHTPPCGSTQTS